MGQGILKVCMRPDDELPPSDNKTANTTTVSTQFKQANETVEHEDDEGMGESFEYSQQNSFYKSKQIGPYLVHEKGESYKHKMKEWKAAIKAPGWKEILEELEGENITIKDKYGFCTSKLDEAIISYYIMSKQHFTELIRQGPPSNRIRWSCWKLLLIQDGKQISFENCLQSEEATIEKDVKRTLTQHQFFQATEDGYTIGHKSLFKVLSAIAYLMPTLGYCQGMNFIAGFLLLVSGGNEELSFNSMVQLITNSRFMLFYMFDSKLGLLVFMEYLAQKQLQQHLPKLYHHLYKVLEVPNSFWLTKITLTIFLYQFKIENCLRLWDYVLTNDIFYIISLLCGILQQYQEEILVIKDMADIVEWFNKFNKETLDNNCLKQSEKYRISHKTIQQAATEYCKVNDNEFVLQLQNYPNVKSFLKDNIDILGVNS